MPRAGQLKSSDERRSDRVAVGVLTQAFPQSLGDEVLAETGRVQQRNRLLPARLVVYFVLAMCLFSGQSYEGVIRLLTAGVQGVRRWRGSWGVPSTAAVWRARSRLGVAPLRQLFVRVCRPVAAPGTVGAFYRGWRLTVIDGTNVRPARHEGERGGVRPTSLRRVWRTGRRLPADPHGRPGGVWHPRHLRHRARSASHGGADSGPGGPGVPAAGWSRMSTVLCVMCGVLRVVGVPVVVTLGEVVRGG
ncbi:transposase domain-containing protein, partial [Streptomyces sp. NPDC087659]|uniref:transposase domain-containing protein n=1 Tax=Streptomyces sp. NPDC087659 TaxID=3365801 RepID=UPI0037F27892